MGTIEIDAMGPVDDTPAATSPVHERVGVLMRKGKRRYTPRCRDVIEVLASTARPLTAEEVCGGRPGLSISTVYRAAGVLADVGAVRNVFGADHRLRFELSEALSAHHHHHLLCRRCGVVFDYELPDDLERNLHAAIARIGRRTGFTVISERFDLEGFCLTCTA